MPYSISAHRVLSAASAALAAGVLSIAGSGIAVGAPGPTTATFGTNGIPIARAILKGQGSGLLEGATNMVVANAVSPMTGDRGTSAVAVVPVTKGLLVAGDVLVANAAGPSGGQNEGTTIVEVDPTQGTRRLLYVSNLTSQMEGPLSISINPVSGTVWVADRGRSPLGLDANITAISPSGVLQAAFDETSVSQGAVVPSIFGLQAATVAQSGTGTELFWTQASAAGASLWRAKVTTSPSGGLALRSFQLISSSLPSMLAAGPGGVAVNAPTGTAYVTDSASDQVMAFPGAMTATSPVQPQSLFAGPPLAGPHGITLATPNGVLWTSNGTNNTIIGISRSGQIVGSYAALPGASPNQISAPAATTTAGHATIWFADSSSATVHALQGTGYVVAASDGSIFASGGLSVGFPATTQRPPQVAGVAADLQTGGYWLATRHGRILPWDTPWAGAPHSLAPGAVVVGIAFDARTGGYWVATSKGNVYNFGGAPWKGSLAHTKLGAPVVGIASGNGGAGYYLALSNGQVINFGIPWLGSTHVERIATPIAGIASPALGHGYWLFSPTGEVFGFGVTQHGSLAGNNVAGSVTAMTSTPTGNGYYLFTSSGSVYGFGAAVLGSPPQGSSRSWVAAAS